MMDDETNTKVTEWFCLCGQHIGVVYNGWLRVGSALVESYRCLVCGRRKVWTPELECMHARFEAAIDAWIDAKRMIDKEPSI